MHLTEEELEQIIQEEFNNLINEEEIDEKLFTALKNLGRGLVRKASDTLSGKPNPKASAGVGRAFARYKVPQKQPISKEPEKKPTTALAIRPSSAVGEPQISEPDTEKADYVHAYVKKPAQLPPGEVPQQKPVEPSGELPSSENIPLQLPEPKKIGILKDYGSLMSSVEGEDYRNLHDNGIVYFSKTPYYLNLSEQQKNIAKKNIDTVLKHLVATKRIIQNPTIGPLQEDNTRPTPSLQQIGQTDFNSWYVASLVNTTIKHFAGSIPDEIIKFVIGFLFNQGRLAISQRLYNKLIHTNDPRVTQDLSQEPNIQKEYKKYNSFYNNWKKYIGVKI
jgi:hypothetical protein